MNPIGAKNVDVFPITTSAFGFPADWYEMYTTRLIEPSFVLMVLMLVIAIGVAALRRFEDFDIENKLWSIPILILSVTFWPLLILGLKSLVDEFNTFLVRVVFQMPWEGFGFPPVRSVTDIVGWSAESLVRLLPNLSYWVIYAFFIVLFFFYAALGPFLLAKSILFDEIEGLLDLIREITILFLWQSTVIILVAFVMPEIVSGRSLPENVEDNFYFLSFILGLMLLFAPGLTRKFAGQVSSGPSPHGIRLRNLFLGMTAASWTGSAGLAAAGFHAPQGLRSAYHGIKHWALMPIEMTQRRRARERVENLARENRVLKHEVGDIENEIEQIEGERGDMQFIKMMQLARKEMEERPQWD